MKSPQMHCLASRALHGARDIEDALACYWIASTPLLCIGPGHSKTDGHCQGESWTLTVFTSTALHLNIMFSLLKISSWNSCMFVRCTGGGSGRGGFNDFNLSQMNVIWHLTLCWQRRSWNKDLVLIGFIVVHCLQLDELKLLEVTEEHIDFT